MSDPSYSTDAQTWYARYWRERERRKRLGRWARRRLKDRRERITGLKEVARDALHALTDWNAASHAVKISSQSSGPPTEE